MEWLEWIADQHVWAMLFAIAASLLLLHPLVAAQRPGRGIKPWWVTSRYLAWIGLIASFFAIVTGELLANKLGLLGGEWILRGEWTDLRIHQYLGGASIFLAYFCLRATYIPRKEHQGLGPLALVMAIFWAILAGGAGYYGIKLAKTRKIDPNAPLVSTMQESEKLAETLPFLPIGTRLLSVLDYASLTSVHTEPVRITSHGNRWARVWVSDNAADAYIGGETLPEGALLVMNTVEDRWNRPTHEIGPLYWMEILPSGKPRLGLYWSNVPEAKRSEFEGQRLVNFVSPHEKLASCLECHADGIANPRFRSRTRPTPIPPRPRPAIEPGS